MFVFIVNVDEHKAPNQLQSTTSQKRTSDNFINLYVQNMSPIKQYLKVKLKSACYANICSTELEIVRKCYYNCPKHLNNHLLS